MESSLLQQCWNQQQPLPIQSHSIIPVVDQQTSKSNRSQQRRGVIGYLRSIDWKTFFIALFIGGLVSSIALATVLTIYIKDRDQKVSLTISTTTTTSTSSTSSTSTTSSSTSTSTSSTSSTPSTSTTSSSSSTSSTSTSSTTSLTTTSQTTTPPICGSGSTAITFDDRSAGIVPNGYQGMNWTNANSYVMSTNTSGYYTAIVTKSCGVYNSGGSPLTMKSVNGSLFNLYSMTTAAAWYDNLQLVVVGYQSNVVIASSIFTLQVFTASPLTFTGYSGVDTIVLTTSGGTKNAGVGGSGTHLGMDNVCLSFI